MADDILEGNHFMVICKNTRRRVVDENLKKQGHAEVCLAQVSALCLHRIRARYLVKGSGLVIEDLFEKFKLKITLLDKWRRERL
jgi:hypothetical protein